MISCFFGATEVLNNGGVKQNLLFSVLQLNDKYNGNTNHILCVIVRACHVCTQVYYEKLALLALLTHMPTHGY